MHPGDAAAFPMLLVALVLAFAAVHGRSKIATVTIGLLPPLISFAVAIFGLVTVDDPFLFAAFTLLGLVLAAPIERRARGARERALVDGLI